MFYLCPAIGALMGIQMFLGLCSCHTSRQQRYLIFKSENSCFPPILSTSTTDSHKMDPHQTANGKMFTYQMGQPWDLIWVIVGNEGIKVRWRRNSRADLKRKESWIRRLSLKAPGAQITKLGEYGWKRCSNHWLFRGIMRNLLLVNFFCQLTISQCFMLSKICNTLCKCRQRRAKDLWINGSTQALWAFICNPLPYPEEE